MKVVAISGSPRKKGNTAKVLALLEELFGDKHELDIIEMASHQVHGCLGCYACMKNNREPGCAQQDDAIPIFERMMQSDLTIYASPLYWWGFSSHIKALIDRHLCMIKGDGTQNFKSLLDGKKVALLVTCDGPIENNADFIQGEFERVSEYCKCQLVGKYIVPSCIAHDTIATKGNEIAKTMATDILESLKI
jgi:multimeric flavodoxin WrbA